mmetsp:Transcript_1062/g.2300  ORF Transcript_1062/g.2300 Transcript_1062/m.2300 type:complete len:374 (+) Transcript_1062:118-1239(+)|eukprot:CAMPEP_0194340728 /NCGR_PEP_ID=MMETSP0171-20130528/87413_1 /TAXON_ID=218684 /ORGANISM="Corethron pennatum, Strain L29A3" /LENGTH=373 /DNA_ID=CAMNT_0039105801 /DNA_START=79 /DNA_END=1200 /DNA_ORIENTATION=-
MPPFQNIEIDFIRLSPCPDPAAVVTESGSTAAKPCPRSSHGLSVHLDGSASVSLLLFGGEHIARTPLPLSQIFWSATKNSGEWTWKSLENTLPPDMEPRVAHAQAVCGDYLYIFGGRSGITMAECPFDDLWRYHVPSMAWERVDTHDGCPSARSFHKMVAHGDSCLYVFGGCGASGRLKDLWLFDTKKQKWEFAGESHLLAGRGGSHLLALQDGAQEYLAAVGGFSGCETNDGHMYDIGSKAWRTEGADATDMRMRSVGVYGSFRAANLSVIFGGEVDPSDRGHEGAGGFANDVVAFVSRGGAIQVLGTFENNQADEKDWPEARGWSDGCACEEKGRNMLYLYGGLTGNDECPQRLDDLWVCEVHVKNQEFSA